MGKSAPTPPDPRVTAAAQTATNVTTALANAQLGNVDQYGPDGSKTYAVDPDKAQTFTDPTTNATYTIPKYIETTTLSPGQQAIKNQADAASLNLATLGNNLSGTLGQQLTGNFSFGDANRTKEIVDLQRMRIDPRMAQEEETLRTRLANQGIKAGSLAYDREMQNFNQSKNDAYTQMELNARGLLNQEALSQDNQRINQISALLNGGQVSQPQFGNVQMPSLPTVDYAGLVNQNYQQQLAAWQQEQAQTNSIVGGLFGLGSAGLFKYSDERLKTKKRKIATLYEYEMKGSPGKKEVGVMAQELEKTKPGLVKKDKNGTRMVNYGALYKAGAK